MLHVSVCLHALSQWPICPCRPRCPLGRLLSLGCSSMPPTHSVSPSSFSLRGEGETDWPGAAPASSRASRACSLPCIDKPRSSSPGQPVVPGQPCAPAAPSLPAVLGRSCARGAPSPPAMLGRSCARGDMYTSSVFHLAASHTTTCHDTLPRIACRPPCPLIHHCPCCLPGVVVRPQPLQAAHRFILPWPLVTLG